ncbi:sugar transferase [Adlercreutzia sp. ZJ141]|uniref:sugar transferase n=1 Tax=Adlercreutzia sp. ZJ141 TaxID=2709406 RepID=UPI0013EA4CD4|nr:sugar transferase [Adlercreutzia sp. ZJ141]
MKWLSWDELPESMRCDEVRPYYDSLAKKRGQLVVKRVFDIIGSLVLFALTWWLFIILAIAIKLDSPGPVFYRQMRVTQYGKEFRIFKFRTMVQEADKIGSAVTTNDDNRVTRVGAVIRKYRLDEFSQLIDVLRGTMSFVGTRPEVPKYVASYTPEMMATLLLPAGVTSTASITFKDEAELLDSTEDVDQAYVKDVLPRKMACNLKDIASLSFSRDAKLVLVTTGAVMGFRVTVSKPYEKEVETVGWRKVKNRNE